MKHTIHPGGIYEDGLHHHWVDVCLGEALVVRVFGGESDEEQKCQDRDQEAQEAAEAISRIMDARLPHAPVCVVEIKILRPEHLTPESLAESFKQMAYQLPGFMSVSMREEFTDAKPGLVLVQ